MGSDAQLSAVKSHALDDADGVLPADSMRGRRGFTAEPDTDRAADGMCRWQTATGWRVFFHFHTTATPRIDAIKIGVKIGQKIPP